MSSVPNRDENPPAAPRSSGDAMDKARNFMAFLSEKTKEIAQDTALKFNQVKSELSSPPEQLTCKGCETILRIPDTTFDWNCPRCTLSNGRLEEKCRSCGTAHPPEKPVQLQCPNCRTINDVPRNKVTHGFNEAGIKMQKFFAQATESAKLEFEPPTKFNCSNCATNIDLQNFRQEGGVAETKIPDNMECPSCHQRTSVPKMKIINELKTTSHNVEDTLKRWYYQISELPFINCPKCSHPILIKQDSAPSTSLVCDQCRHALS